MSVSDSSRYIRSRPSPEPRASTPPTGLSLIPMAGPPLIPKDVQLVATRADTEGLPARRRTHLAQSWCESSLAFSLVEPQYAIPNADVGAQSC
eukprot:scaffold90710_cov98-Phaeocystis_antarctica.AAC.1